jgi:choice-of-anchor B domain-containing protein
MKAIISYLFSTILCLTVYSQYNITLKSHINYQDFRGVSLNGIWGYVDSQGNEYAIVGTRSGVSVVSLANPENPVEVYWHEGQFSIWREIKTYGNYAYVTTEAPSGLLIIDMSPLPNNPIVNYVYYTGPANHPWQTAHTLYIDEEEGYCYIFGANRGNGGAIILDIATDPMNPIEVGVFDNWYVHDGFARGNKLYLAHINQGFFSVVDITNKSNPVLLGTASTPKNFTHNVWLSVDNQFLFATDEVSGAYIASYDISDPTNIIELDRIQSNPGLGIVPHNVHVKNNWLVTSYYTDGVLIHDASRPFNLIETGSFDTTPLQNTNMQGCWSVYPYFPSGLIVASDIELGLFVLEPNYKLGSYLEGNVYDASDGNALSGVTVTIEGNNQSAITNLSGSYATGIVQDGNFNVSYVKPLYYPQTHTVNLAEGVVTNFNVNLEPMPSFNLTITVLEEITNQPIFDAFVRFEVPLHVVNLTTNGLGEAELVLYYMDTYKITVGKWGFVTSCTEMFINNQTGSLTIHLKKGWYDDFSFDFGWSTTSTATQGHWVREIPIASSSGSAPGIDAPADCNGFAFLTGNGSMNPNLDQVTNGIVTLISPVFDLTEFSDPHINYWTWYYNFHGPNPPPDDTLKIFLSNGNEMVLIDFKAFPDATQSLWEFSSIRVTDHITPSSTMQLFVQISDFPETVNITEAGFDYFSVSNSNTVSSLESEATMYIIFPNPSNGSFKITHFEKVKELYITDVHGRRQDFLVKENWVFLTNAQAGVYFVELITFDGERIVKLISIDN